MTEAYKPTKKLVNMANKMLPMTTSGQNIMTNPATGTHAVSRKGPSRLIKSCNNLCHPLNNIYGLFNTEIIV